MTLWQRLLATSRNSATHLWANTVILLAGATEAAAEFSDQLGLFIADAWGDPELKAQVVALIPQKHVGLVTVAIMIVTKIARNRTLSKK